MEFYNDYIQKVTYDKTNKIIDFSAITKPLRDGCDYICKFNDDNPNVVTECFEAKSMSFEIRNVKEGTSFENTYSCSVKVLEYEDGREYPHTENVVVVEPDKGEANAKLRLDSYKKIIGTNKFTIEATVKEVGTDNLEYPFTYIRNGNGAYIETAVPFEEGKVVKANMIIVDGKTYCEIPSLKCYMIVDDMSIEDLADGTFDKNSIDAYKFVESGTVTLNGKKYTCDVYEYDTDTIKYYYNSKGEIVRIEKINSRESVITEIKSLKKTADNSKIKKPKGINITSLVS